MLHLGGVAQSILARIPRRSDGAGRVVVLCYHSIHPTKGISSASPELFDQHLAWLKQHCTCVPFAKILDHVGASSEKPVVALTFDDGYEDNHTSALPLLLEHGLSAAFFITCGLIDRDPSVLSHVADSFATPAEELVPLTWQQVVEMREAGMEIGAHSVTHRNFARLPADEVLEEMTQGKDLLEQQLGSAVGSLAYPYGIPKRHFSDTVMALARDAGYERAGAILFRDVRSSDSAFAIPRLAVTGDSLEMLRAKIIGRLDLVGMWQERAPEWAARAVSSPEFRRI
jgi:peptidoglycan/xylan/chitin deacetylase (PgdA/CDA1 family)